MLTVKNKSHRIAELNLALQWEIVGPFQVQEATTFLIIKISIIIVLTKHESDGF